MFCSQCGKQIGESNRFCNFCGASQQPDVAIPAIAPNGSAPMTPQASDDRERTIKEAGVHVARLGPKAMMAQRKIIVTNRRVIYREGLIGQKEMVIPLSKVTDVSIQYSMAGRVVGYGTLRIESAGNAGTEIVAEDIADAKGVRDAILNMIR
jgi:hypothetical protein